MSELLVETRDALRVETLAYVERINANLARMDENGRVVR